MRRRLCSLRRTGKSAEVNFPISLVSRSLLETLASRASVSPQRSYAAWVRTGAPRAPPYTNPLPLPRTKAVIPSERHPSVRFCAGLRGESHQQDELSPCHKVAREKELKNKIPTPKLKTWELGLLKLI
jgi:hypothetical protein